jgi:hypothetical protein
VCSGAGKMKSISALCQELLWLWNGDSSGSQEIERTPLEAGTSGLVRDSRPRRGVSVCVVNCRLSEIELDCEIAEAPL